AAVTRTLLGGAILAMVAINSGCGGDDTQTTTPPDSGTVDTSVADSGSGPDPRPLGSGEGDTHLPGTHVPDTNVPDTQLQKAATPTFNPDPTTGPFTSAQNVQINDTTAGATIFYTTDGTNPTTASLVYSAAIAVTQTTTIRAMAAANGFSNSDV